jgi:hypothetical protein
MTPGSLCKIRRAFSRLMRHNVPISAAVVPGAQKFFGQIADVIST